MKSFAVLIGRIIAGCLGAILIYSALFLYKEEEGGLENRLEQWWQKIRDLHAHAISRETAFMKVVADVTSNAFTKLFGERLFGPKAIAASMCYSQAAVFLVSTIMMMLPRFTHYVTARQAVELGLTFGTMSLFFLSVGSLGPFIHRPSHKLLWLSFVLIATAGWPLLVAAVYGRILSSTSGGTYEWPALGYGIEFGAILFAVVCDFLFIALTRVMLARAARSNSFITIIALAVGNACLAAVLCVAPLLIGVQTKPIVPAYSHFYAILIEIGGILILLVGVSNVLDALVSLSWFIFATVLLLHRLIWPLIERPVYALFRYRVFSEQKKLVFFSGVALIGLAIPRVGQALESLVKAIHG